MNNIKKKAAAIKEQIKDATNDIDNDAFVWIMREISCWCWDEAYKAEDASDDEIDYF
ncbi:MAG: hypothetical protein HUJ96_06130 [Marinilabiliaceae bacterium]|nr:hypothetical protein [Marinilabiliaceae bacterium]